MEGQLSFLIVPQSPLGRLIGKSRSDKISSLKHDTSRTTHQASHIGYEGNPYLRVLRYGEEDSNSPSTLFFAATKG